MAALRRNLSTFFDSYTVQCCCAIAFFIPLKLLVTYVLLIPLLIAWVIARGRRAFAQPLLIPLFVFAVATLVSSLFGFNPLRSFRGLLSLVFFSLSVGLFAEAFRSPKGALVIVSLLAGQALGCGTGVLQSAFPIGIERIFLGKIAESGQLSLTVITALAVLLTLTDKNAKSPWPLFESQKLEIGVQLLFGGIATLLLVALGFSNSLPALSSSKLLIVTVLGGALLVVLLTSVQLLKREMGRHALQLSLVVVVLPCLIAGLLVNLKRGPWFGIAVSALLLLLVYRRKVIVPLLLAGGLALICLAPVRARLAHSSHDFFIHGGRSVIWEIGAELAPRYPLGIGYKNSRVLRAFTEQVPPELTHFHNNAINLLVETGWIGLLAYAWWILSLLRAGAPLTGRHGIIPAAASLSILAWQLAGIVEYNAGDSEVMLVGYVLVGLLTAVTTPKIALTPAASAAQS